MALELGVKGLMNTQYAIHQKNLSYKEIQELERFLLYLRQLVSYGKVATRVMWGESLRDALNVYDRNQKIVDIKTSSNILKPILKGMLLLKRLFSRLIN